MGGSKQPAKWCRDPNTILPSEDIPFEPRFTALYEFDQGVFGYLPKSLVMDGVDLFAVWQYDGARCLGWYYDHKAQRETNVRYHELLRLRDSHNTRPEHSASGR